MRDLAEAEATVHKDKATLGGEPVFCLGLAVLPGESGSNHGGLAHDDLQVGARGLVSDPPACLPALNGLDLEVEGFSELGL